MFSAAANFNGIHDNVLSINFKSVCPLLVQNGHQAICSYPVAARPRTPHCPFEPMAWVYASHYDDEPMGVLYSPTQSLVFFLPFDENGDLCFDEVSYLDLFYNDVAPILRSGKSILAERLGGKTDIESPSLLRWIERIAYAKTPV